MVANEGCGCGEETSRSPEVVLRYCCHGNEVARGSLKWVKMAFLGRQVVEKQPQITLGDARRLVEGAIESS